MPQLRFNHVFAGLLVLSLLSAFFIDPKYTGWTRGVAGFFRPVSWTSRQAADTFFGRVRPGEVTDKRPDLDIRAENERLKATVAYLQGQLEDLARRTQERKQLGKLLEFCVPAAVTGGDGGGRDSILVEVPEKADVRDNMPVIYPYGLVGRVTNAQAGRVRLITDKDSKAVNVSFGRLVQQPDGHYAMQRLPTKAVLLAGAGSGGMIARQWLTVKEVQSSGLKTGDWALLAEDADFSRLLTGIPVGQVTDIRQSLTGGGMYADVYVQPLNNLARLSEVMILTKR